MEKNTRHLLFDIFSSVFEGIRNNHYMYNLIRSLSQGSFVGLYNIVCSQLGNFGFINYNNNNNNNDNNNRLYLTRVNTFSCTLIFHVPLTKLRQKHIYKIYHKGMKKKNKIEFDCAYTHPSLHTHTIKHPNLYKY